MKFDAGLTGTREQLVALGRRAWKWVSPLVDQVQKIRIPWIARWTQPSARNPSFTRRLLGWGLGSTLFFTLLAGIALFVFVWVESEDNQDDVLEEVSMLIARMDTATATGSPGVLTMDDDDFEDAYDLDKKAPAAMIPAGAQILIHTLHKGGVSVPAALDRPIRPGKHNIQLNGRPYRMYVRSLANGRHIAVAQKRSIIWETALSAALGAVLPVVLLAATLCIIMACLFYTTFRPVRRWTASIDERGEELSPLEAEGIPEELLPVNDALNGMLERIGELRQREARFVADAAHELRSPLAALSLQAERLAQEDLGDTARRRLDALRSGIARAVEQVSQLLALKRAEAKEKRKAGEKAPETNVVETVSEVFTTLWAEAEKKAIELEAEGFEENPKAAAPMAREDLYAILRNLVENAVRYSPEGGSVKVAMVSSHPFELTVTDTGPGIPEKERARVFEPFYRVLGTGVQGTGLGLAIVQTLASQNGLAAKLEPGPGGAGLCVRLLEKSS